MDTSEGLMEKCIDPNMYITCINYKLSNGLFKCIFVYK